MQQKSMANLITALNKPPSPFFSHTTVILQASVTVKLQFTATKTLLTQMCTTDSGKLAKKYTCIIL